MKMGWGNYLKLRGSRAVIDSSKRAARGLAAGWIRSRHYGPPVHMGAVRERLGQVQAAHLVLTVEVGERARHLQHAMKAARREAHGVGGLADKREPLRIRPRHLFERRRGQAALLGTPSKSSAA